MPDDDARQRLRERLQAKKNKRLGLATPSTTNEAKVHELCGDNVELLRMAHAVMRGTAPPPPPATSDDEDEAPPPSS